MERRKVDALPATFKAGTRASGDRGWAERLRSPRAPGRYTSTPTTLHHVPELHTALTQTKMVGSRCLSGSVRVQMEEAVVAHQAKPVSSPQSAVHRCADLDPIDEPKYSRNMAKSRYDAVADFYAARFESVDDPVSQALLDLLGEIAGLRVLDVALGNWLGAEPMLSALTSLEI